MSACLQYAALLTPQSETFKIFLTSACIYSENYIGIAVLRLMEHERAIVEGAGAAGLAALLAGLLPELKGKR